MCPELFHIGPIPVRSFGVLMALSFLLGVLYVQRITKRDKKPFEPFFMIAYIMIIGGVVGARLAYVLLHLDEFSGHWTRTFNPFGEGQFGIAGLNLYGGVVLALIGTYIYCRWKKMPVLEAFDYFAPTLALGIGITRIGCFLNGCCFGTPTDLPWGIQFPPGSIPTFVFGDAHLHPAQIYSSMYGFGLFLFLHWLMKRRAFLGQLAAVTMMAEAVFRFAIEYVRYYEDAMYFDFMGYRPTFNQFVSVALLLLGLGIYLVQRRRGQLPLVSHKK